MGHGRTEMNFVLETINGTALILAVVLLLFLSFYLASELRRRDLSWHDLFDYPAGMSFALSIAVTNCGVVITRSNLWSWRRLGTGEQMSPWQIDIHLLGTAMTSLGMLWMIRVLSRARFGEWPWITSGGLALIYVAIDQYWHYWLT
jgi:hypothetical protein